MMSRITSDMAATTCFEFNFTVNQRSAYTGRFLKSLMTGVRRKWPFNARQAVHTRFSGYRFLILRRRLVIRPNLRSTVLGARSTTSLLPRTLTYSFSEAFANGKFESVVSFVGKYIRGDS